MISFPNAKINIGLNITGKRPDGYHNLESCFYPVGWSDILEIIPSKTLHFSSTGFEIPRDGADNLCLTAYDLLKKHYDISPVDIHLHKIIPIGAGLGGGSSDGAFTLKMLDEIFELSLSLDQLEEYANQLGSDCPFFIQNQPKFVTGTGNVLQEIDINLSKKHLVIIKPNIHSSTTGAYNGIHPQRPSVNIKDIIEKQSITTWKATVLNDFEQSIFNEHPSIAKIKDLLYEKGSIYASMTGSGAAVYGLFDKKTDIESIHSVIWKGVL